MEFLSQMNFNQILIHLTLAVIKLIFHIHTDINPYDRSLFILMQHPFSPTEWYVCVSYQEDHRDDFPQADKGLYRSPTNKNLIFQR